MSLYQCQSCGAFDSRACNGDNEVCTECGTPDDFVDMDESIDPMESFFNDDRKLEDDEHKFGDKIGKKV